jgi:hypothetical protein
MTQIKGARIRVHVDQYVFVFGAVEVPELLCLRSSCSHVTEVGTVCDTRAEGCRAK